MNYTKLVLQEKREIQSLLTQLSIVRVSSERIELLRVLIQHLQFNQPNIAKDYAQELLDLSLQNRNEETLGFAYNIFATDEIQHGDFRKAQLYCYQALDALNDQQEPFIITCRNLIEILTNQGEYDQAYDYLTYSKETQKYLDLDIYKPYTNAQEAKIHYRKGKYKEAFDICINNLRNYKNSNLLDGWEAVTYHVLGLIYAAQQDYQSSLENYLKSAGIWEKLDNQYQITGLYSNIGSSYIYQKNLTSAEVYFNKALNVDRQNGGNTKMQSLIYQNLAIINYRNKKNAKAKSYYDMALRLCKMINDKLGEMQLLFNMAMMYQNDPEKAIEYYENSLKIAVDIQDTRFIMFNNENLSKEYASLGHYKKAYFHITKAQYLERELFGLERLKAIKEVENEYFAEWRKEEIELLKNKNQTLEEFVQKITNEIKNPLNTVHEFRQLLTEKHANTLNEEGQYYLNTVTDASNYLFKLVERLEEYAFMDTKDLNLESVNVYECLEEVIVDLKKEYPDNQLDISINVFIDLNVDKVMLTRLFQNLLDNAIKFNHNIMPHITIEQDEKSDYNLILIKDNGIGITIENQEKVFDIFETGVSKKEYKNSGIGLAICKKIMENLNGEIRLESSINKGTTVFLKFPKLFSLEN
jgi:signal transduction histidine kinase